MEWFSSLSPVLQGLTATIFTWAVTALGAALVFFFKNVDRKILNSMLGFGAGVMTAASFWSLLNPAIELCGELGYSQFMLPAIGFFAGGVFIIFADMLMDKYSYGVIPVNNNSLETSKSYKKSILLVLAVTLHNIPEGLATALSLAGARVSTKKIILFTFIAGIPMGIGSFLGVYFAGLFKSLIGLFLSLAAGTMLFVVLDEIMPKSKSLYSIIGFLTGTIIVYCI